MTQCCAILRKWHSTVPFFLLHPLNIGRWLIICMMWNSMCVMAARRSWKSTWKEEGKAGGVWWWRKYWQIAVTCQVLQRTDRISLNKYPLFLLLRTDFFNKIVFIRSRLETWFVFKRDKMWRCLFPAGLALSLHRLIRFSQKQHFSKLLCFLECWL